jgi:dihydrofolate reductase
LPEDLKHFKRLTLGHPVIMGRRTWESLKGLLPGRDNIVVSATPGYDAPGAAVANSLEGALALCSGEPVAFVIGGSRLFAESLPIADGLVMTEIDRQYEGDTWFPEYDRSRWKESQRERHVAADGTKFDFVLYEKV